MIGLMLTIFQNISMHFLDWFLYDNGLRHERVNSEIIFIILED